MEKQIETDMQTSSEDEIMYEGVYRGWGFQQNIPHICIGVCTTYSQGSTIISTIKGLRFTFLSFGFGIQSFRG